MLDVTVPSPVTIVRSGRRGRPRKVVDPVFLQNAFDGQRNISIRKLAKRLKIDRLTLAARMKEHNVSRAFTEISDDDLDQIIREYKLQRPTAGFSYIMGYLRSHGLHIQGWRVVQSHRRVSPLAADIHLQDAIERRRYWVQRPNSLWHCDGHHKLIKYGFVTHAFIDGYDRLVSTFQSKKYVFQNLFFKLDCCNGSIHLQLSQNGETTVLPCKAKVRQTIKGPW